MAAMIRRGRRRGGDDTGAELIELAIVLPILLVVFAAIVDFGMLFQRYEVITNAAREGARIGVLPDYTQTDVEDRVEDYLTATGLDPNAATITVTYDNAFPIGAGTSTVSVINVIVAYPSDFAVLGPIVGLVGGAPFATLNLRAGSNMRMEAAGGGS
jgi:Flp pilus assembly protein TadG